MKTTFLRGHINSLKACERDTEDLGVLMRTILIGAKVSAEWHVEANCIKVFKYNVAVCCKIRWNKKQRITAVRCSLIRQTVQYIF